MQRIPWFNYARIAAFPNGITLQRKTISIIAIVLSIFLVTGVIIICTSTFSGNGQSDKDHLKSTAVMDIELRKGNLLKYLYSISGSKTISGVLAHEAATKSYNGIQIIHNITGQFPGIVSTHMPSYSATTSQWMSFSDEVISNWNAGYLVHIGWYWEGDNPLQSLEIFKGGNRRDMERKWSGLIKDGGDINNIWKGHLDLLAPNLQKLQTAGVLPIIDIFPWINSKSYIWRGREGVNGTAKLYQITHDYLTKQHNLSSLIWTWAVHHGDMTQLEKYWPGNDYVDIASVYMEENKELSMMKYQTFLGVVGNKPVTMENMYYVPTVQLLSAQPRWAWFTATDTYLGVRLYNDYSNTKTTFNSPNVINRASIDFFNHTN